MIPGDLRYTEEHEWVEINDGVATVGITQHASEELGELVFVELPDAGAEIEQMSEFGSVESVKTVSSLYLPVGGEVVESNDGVVAAPETINEDPYGDGWLVKIKIADDKELDDLMTADEYEEYLETL